MNKKNSKKHPKLFFIAIFAIISIDDIVYERTGTKACPFLLHSNIETINLQYVFIGY